MKGIRLASSNNNPDFKVNIETGEAYISQRKAADLLGVPKGTLMRHVQLKHPKANTGKGLSPEILFKVNHYFAINARSPTKRAADLLLRIGEAGATAFIYHSAGVSFNDPKKLLSNLTSTQKELEETKSKLTLVVNNQIPKARVTTELLVNLTGNSYLAHEVYINSCHSKKSTKTSTVWVHKPKKKYAKWFVEVNGQLRVKEKYYQEVKDFADELKARK